MPAVETFNTLMNVADYPMFIVTVRDGDERDGCLVGFATQASIHPPRFLVGLSDKNRTSRLAATADHLAVHFVPARESGLARLFGGETGDEVDKFTRCAWHDGPHGVPIIDACASWFAGRITERAPLGDHIGHLLDVVAAEHGADDELMMFHRARSIPPGHAP